jgi:hypothetical protein
LEGRGGLSLEQNNKFDADWDLVNKLDRMAIGYLKDGLSPTETQLLILNSELFKEWKSTDHCLQTTQVDFLTLK